MADNGQVATLATILDIPGNRVVYDHVRGLLTERRALAFVGAGASVPLYPLWGQLITAMADAAVAQVGATDADRSFWVQNAISEPLQVVRQIRQRLQDGRYFPLLYETFKLKSGPDGESFTAAHRALLTLNFKAFMTTNYDEGLVQARLKVRPGLRDTGFVVWNQNFQVNRWTSGEVFADPDVCPILFAHGHHADPESIVLDRDSYRRAYHDTPYGRLMREIWHREFLVFVGFSFKDEVLKQIADQDLWETVRQGGGAPRHVAILGLDVGSPFSPEMRRMYEDQFFADVLFYPVTTHAAGHPDHSALSVVLESLATNSGGWRPPIVAGAATTMPPPSERPARTLTSRFVHETTEDEKFTGRSGALARLDIWVVDPKVSIVAISAIGGTGKTALLATWMRREKIAELRPFAARFFWSFYRDPSARRFLEALCEFGRTELVWTPPTDDRRPLAERAIDLVHRVPILLGLDGLEVIQEDAGGLDYGKVLDYDLADFLDRLAQAPTPSFAVLTSRYPFPDLTPFLGEALRILPLPALDSADGATLLAEMGVRGDAAARAAISDRLEGHPLALRLFARSMPAGGQANPDRHWELIFANAASTKDDALTAKMGRLLKFYSDHLPAEQRETLGLLALFRMPISASVLEPLWRDVLGHTDTAPSLASCLTMLRNDHLLTADVGEDGVARYAAHPILRDFFRALLLGRPGFAKSASRLLNGRPGSTDYLSPEQLELSIVATELLYKDGDIVAASRFVDDSLGKHIVASSEFRLLARILRACQTAIDEHGPLLTSDAVEALEPVSMAIEVAYRHLGDPEYLEQAQRRLLAFMKEKHPRFEEVGFMGPLSNLSAAFAAGNADAIESAMKELRQFYADNTRGEWTGFTLVFQMMTYGITGDLPRLAPPIWSEFFSDDTAAMFQVGFGFSAAIVEILVTAGDISGAARLTTHLYDTVDYDDNRILSNAAVADYLRAWIAAVGGSVKQSRDLLNRAKAVFLKAPMVYELAKLHLVEARLALVEGNDDAAMAAANCALRIAAPRKYRLIHADALNLRAAAWLARESADPRGARDDSEAALHLAEACSYRWAERDACELLALCSTALGQPADAAHQQKRFETLRKQLALPGGTSIVPPLPGERVTDGGTNT